MYKPIFLGLMPSVASVTLATRDVSYAIPLHTRVTPNLEAKLAGRRM
jgi:hypothetical protein